MKPTMISRKRVVFSVLLLTGLCVFGQAAADCVDYGGSDAIPLITLRGLDSTPYRVVVSGTTAFLFDGQQNVYPFPGLTAVDVSNPAAPIKIGHVQAPWSYDLAV